MNIERKGEQRTFGRGGGDGILFFFLNMCSVTRPSSFSLVEKGCHHLLTFQRFLFQPCRSSCHPNFSSVFFKRNMEIWPLSMVTPSLTIFVTESLYQTAGTRWVHCQSTLGLHKLQAHVKFTVNPQRCIPNCKHTLSSLSIHREFIPNYRHMLSSLSIHIGITQTTSTRQVHCQSTYNLYQTTSTRQVHCQSTDNVYQTTSTRWV